MDQLTLAKRLLADREYLYFDELSPEAKRVALDNYAQGFGHGYEWWDYTIEDAVTQFKTLGVDTTTKDCAFSGFSSQGDGASFTGYYRYSRGAAKNIKAECPQDTELHRIARELQAVQRRYFYGLTARITRNSHHYSHPYTVSVDCECERRAVEDGDREAIEELMRDLMVWMYKNLEAEYEYQSCGDGAVESIVANEYPFNEDGTDYKE